MITNGDKWCKVNGNITTNAAKNSAITATTTSYDTFYQWCSRPASKVHGFYTVFHRFSCENSGILKFSSGFSPYNKLIQRRTYTWPVCRALIKARGSQSTPSQSGDELFSVSTPADRKIPLLDVLNGTRSRTPASDWRRTISAPIRCARERTAPVKTIVETEWTTPWTLKLWTILTTMRLA